MMIVSDLWKQTYPGAAVGLLAMQDVANPERHAALDQHKEALEEELRLRFASYDRVSLREMPALKAYHNYYKRFDKTYHVQLQLESVVFKGKSIPRVAALVECMFMAELKNQLLTAMHDMDVLELPVRLDVADGSEKFIAYNGEEKVLKPGDMYIADRQGVISSVIYGPDQRTRIRPETRRALFTAYAPPGIDEKAVWEHLEDIQANVRLIAPEAKTETIEVYRANPSVD
jgi:DNA/RNA-binding domain of Phe-tRNA-synthetase-like protein